ncbi:hypothetical protein SK128_007735, partial [Halocaridina rubra]
KDLQGLPLPSKMVVLNSDPHEIDDQFLSAVTNTSWEEEEDGHRAGSNPRSLVVPVSRNTLLAIGIYLTFV